MTGLNGSVASIKNEVVATLANITVDLALVKYEAPPEFLQVGQTISKKRKESAEEGHLHRTARKLGELFKNIIPNTPSLLRAYGNRVSEITAESSVNPRATQFRDGLFSAYVGIDSGSIWAAATSGSPALAVHLLACMLARTFTVEQATSIWVELVEQHKERLESASQEDLFPDVAAKAALSQEIRREDLSTWDASARAWLQSADEAKLFQHKQMDLIINDSGIPVNSEPTVYGSVIAAWVEALRAMENLIHGIPQKIQDGAALLAISAWHLYLNMIVYRGRNGKEVDVKMNDTLLQPTGLLTIGLEPIHPLSVSWSLPLTRIQYYSDPVRVNALTGQDNTRISPEEFSFVVLGGVLFTWATSDFKTTVSRTLTWLDRIILCSEIMKSERNEGRHYDWVHFLRDAAEAISKSQGLRQSTATQLYQLGARRSKTFLEQERPVSALFNINEIFTLLRLLRVDDKGTETRRSVVQKANLFHNGKYPAVLIVLASSKFSESVFLGHSVFWISVRPDEVANYKQTKELPDRLSEYVDRGSCIPVLFHVTKPGQGTVSKMVIVFGTGKSFSSGLESLTHSDCNPERTYLFLSYHQDGRPDSDVLYERGHLSERPNLKVDDDFLWDVFTPDTIDPEKVRFHLLNIRQTRSFQIASACAVAISILNDIPGATIKTSILERGLDNRLFSFGNGLRPQKEHISLSETFVLLCFMESGVYIDQAQLSKVFALSTGNSIYVANSILSDPYETSVPLVRRIIGNIGRPGLSFLVPPAAQKISQPSEQNWRVINHNDFDGKSDDYFGNTSVHLSFTGYELGIRPSGATVNSIDHAVKIVETAISAYDGSSWVADLDIFVAFSSTGFPTGEETHGYRQICEGFNPDVRNTACSGLQSTFRSVAAAHGAPNITAIDSWDEILDPPQNHIIAVRAAGNWVARLALAAVCARKGYCVVIANKTPCWHHFFALVRDKSDQDVSYLLQEDPFAPTDDSSNGASQVKRKTMDNWGRGFAKRYKFSDKISQDLPGFDELLPAYHLDLAETYDKFALIL